ncbi:MAG: hypothetical protein ACREC6_01205 [Hyphomicrobiaceae bacterium]
MAGLSALFKPPKVLPPPKLKPPVRMPVPDDQASREAALRKQREVMATKGRAATNLATGTNLPAPNSTGDQAAAPTYLNDILGR